MEKALGRRVTFALAFLGGKSDQAGPLADSWCPCRHRLSTRITWVTIHASALLAVAEAGSPYTTAGGKDARVRVYRVDRKPGDTEIRVWRAHERVSVKRATAEEGKR
jgi:hypothetical protein